MNPFDTNYQGWFLRFIRRFVLAILLLVASMCIILLAVNVSHAHGYAMWFNQPYYVSKSGMHCCGPNDCKYLEEWHATVVEDEFGYTVDVPKRKQMVDNEYGGPVEIEWPADHHYFSKKEDYKHGLYFTEDPDNKYVLCLYGGKIKCLAVPRKTGI
jgi:hypothetical protein